MSVGELRSKVIPDDPSRVHYGPEDVVTGKVVLEYRPRKNSEGTRHPDLFGPLQLDIVFEGVMSVRVNEFSEAGRLYKDLQSLFSHSVRLVDGPFRLAANSHADIPFQVAFPARTAPRTKMTCLPNDSGQLQLQQERVDDGVPLPPSFDTAFFQSRRGGERGAVKIEYTLAARLEMPGIDVRTEVGEYKPRVRYEQARRAQPPLANTSFMGSLVTITSPKLGGGSGGGSNGNGNGGPGTGSRPQGFKGKAKAFFHPVDQTIVFDLFCTGVPQEACLGTPLTCEVGVRVHAERSTVGLGGGGGDGPGAEIMLDHFAAHVVAHTRVQVDGRWGERERPDDIQVVRTLAGVAHPPGPFAAATGFTKTVRTADVLHGVPASFRLDALTRSYKLRLELQVSVAGQTRHVRRDLPFVVCPPLMGSDDEDEDEGTHPAGSARGVPGSSRVMIDEELPGYGEAAMEGPPPRWTLAT